MAVNNSHTRRKDTSRHRTFSTLAEWKEAHLPETARQEVYQTLRKDAEHLAETLANDTFERVRGRREI